MLCASICKGEISRLIACTGYSSAGEIVDNALAYQQNRSEEHLTVVLDT